MPASSAHMRMGEPCRLARNELLSRQSQASESTRCSADAGGHAVCWRPGCTGVGAQSLMCCSRAPPQCWEVDQASKLSKTAQQTVHSEAT